MFRSRRLLGVPQRYADLLLGMTKDIYAALRHQPEWIGRILNGEEPPLHWTAANEAHLPDDPALRRKVRALIHQVARRLAVSLSEREAECNRLSARRDQAQAEQETALQAADRFTQIEDEQRAALREHAGRIAALDGQNRSLRRRIRAAQRGAAGWFLAAAGTLAGEVVAIAAVLFQIITDADLTQQLGTWAVAISAAVALAVLVERGLGPLLDPAQAPAADPRGRRVVILALVFTALLTGAIAWVRVLSIGEGGASDAAHFLMNVITVPFLAFAAGGCAAAGRRLLAGTLPLKAGIEAHENERDLLDAVLFEQALVEQDLASLAADISRRAAEADDLESEASLAKQEILQQLYQEVVESADIQQLIAARARDAAEIEGGAPVPRPGPAGGECGGSRFWRIPTGWWNPFGSLLLVLSLLPLLSGCMGPGGGATAPTGEAVVVDPSPSVTDKESFRQEIRGEFARFQRAAPGSVFELWVMAKTPGSPRLLFPYTVTKALPRERAQRRKAALADLEAAMAGLFPPEPVPWSPVLEDGYRAAQRLSGLPLGRRRLVLLSDLLQYSPALTVNGILQPREFGPLVDSVLQIYSPLAHAPDEVRLVHLPGRVGGPGTLEPARWERVKEFWRTLWTAWGARRVELTEPAVIQQDPKGAPRP